MMKDSSLMHGFEAIIDDDEHVLWSDKPVLIPFLAQGLAILVIGIVWFMIVGAMIPNETFGFGGPSFSVFSPFILIPNIVRFGPLIIGVISMIRLFLVYNNTQYAITSKRLLFKTGFLGIDYKIIDYDQIKNMEVNVNPLERAMNVGSIRIFTGETITHERTTRAVPTIMVAINNPYDVFKQLKKVSVDIKTDWNYPNQYRPKDNDGYNTDYRP